MTTVTSRPLAPGMFVCVCMGVARCAASRELGIVSPPLQKRRVIGSADPVPSGSLPMALMWPVGAQLCVCVSLSVCFCVGG